MRAGSRSKSRATEAAWRWSCRRAADSTPRPDELIDDAQLGASGDPALDPLDQIDGLEGLGDVVVGTGVVAGLNVAREGLGRAADDGDVRGRPVGPEPSDQLQP